MRNSSRAALSAVDKTKYSARSSCIKRGHAKSAWTSSSLKILMRMRLSPLEFHWSASVHLQAPFGSENRLGLNGERRPSAQQPTPSFHWLSTPAPRLFFPNQAAG